MIDHWSAYPLLAAVGLVGGTLNVVAGGGSFLTLPVLIFLGLPPGVANGTNRVGILLQNVSAVWSFDRHGVLDRRAVLWAAVPAMAGATVGALLALRTSDAAFQRLLATLMVVMALASLWRPSVKPQQRPQRTFLLAAGFFGVGIYAGFVQAGVGFLVLAVTTAAGLDLVRGNAVKVLSILCATVLSLGIFAWQGQVRWGLGLALAVGMALGGALGARLSLQHGHRWIRGVVTAMVIVFAIRLWLG